MKRFSLRCVMFLVIMAICQGSSPGQNRSRTRQAKLPNKIRAFLGPKGEMGRRGLTFTGKVITLPEGLRKALEVHFYLHRFTIVRMRVESGITANDLDLFIVTDAESGEVVAHAEQLGGVASESFKQLLTAYPNVNGRHNADNLDTTKAQIKALGDLLLYSDRGREYDVGSRVGTILEYRKGKVIEIRVELIPRYFPRWVLIVPMAEIELKDDKVEYKFGRLSIVDVDSDELRK